jgi:hypothetical protein
MTHPQGQGRNPYHAGLIGPDPLPDLAARARAGDEEAQGELLSVARYLVEHDQHLDLIRLRFLLALPLPNATTTSLLAAYPC